MTGSRREVVHCLTSDCRIWHSYSDESDENRYKRNARLSRRHDDLQSDNLGVGAPAYDGPLYPQQQKLRT